VLTRQHGHDFVGNLKTRKSTKKQKKNKQKAYGPKRQNILIV
jgi:hypothetical protein